ncbi:MAG: methionine--tRNA ligase, partial [Candidatus Pacearchaeota archaeon]
MEKRLITAALPYVNNLPHLGHIVGCHLPADIFSRFCRLKGYKTLFVGGTDENGSTSEIAAEEIGVDINVYCDKLYEEHKKIYDWFLISYDNFSRTSKKIHHETTQDFFKKLYSRGFVDVGTMKVFYSPFEKRFLADRYVKGTCPKCGYGEANGDQCEKCTSVIDPLQLINPVSIISGTPLEIKEVEHLFLRLDKLSKNLEEWLKEKKDIWREQVISLALGWIKEGLKPRCITRDLKHGVKVPLKGFEEKVFYVWFDAPIGYISSTKEATKEWESFWKDKNTKIYHFLGKDNIPFHTIFWPGMLIGNGEFNLPYFVEGLQYLNFEGEKFSKSKKRGVFCEGIIKSEADPDIFRAYLSFIMPDTSDSEFSWEDFQRRINNELIGNLGNFINRTISFAYSKLNGEIARPKELREKDKIFIEEINKSILAIEENLEKVRLRNAFQEIFSISAKANKYFNDEEPWKKIKIEKERTEEVIYICLELCRIISLIISPYLPSTSKKIREQLNLGEIKESCWKEESTLLKEKVYKVNKPKILFKQIDKEY